MPRRGRARGGWRGRWSSRGRHGEASSYPQADPEGSLTLLRTRMVDGLISKARVLEMGITTGEKREYAMRIEGWMAEALRGCHGGMQEPRRIEKVKGVLIEALGNLPPGIAARIAALLCSVLLECGHSAMHLSIALSAMRSSNCITTLLPPTLTLNRACEDGRAVVGHLDRMLISVFGGWSKPRPKAILSTLDAFSAVTPLLPSLGGDRAVEFVRRLSLTSIGGDSKVAALIAPYLRAPLHLHYVFFQRLLERRLFGAALEALRRMQNMQGMDAVESMGLAPALVQELMAAGDYRMASRVAREAGIAQQYPIIEQAYRENSIRKLVQKGKWQLAEAMLTVTDGTEGERQLKACLVNALLDAEQVLRVARLRVSLGVEDLVPEPDSAAVEAEIKDRESRYLQLPVPPDRIIFVNDYVSLDKAKAILAEAVGRAEDAWCNGRPEVLGLDVEWRPTLYTYYAKKSIDRVEEDEDKLPPDRDGKEVASILQVATRTDVMLVDLRALCSTPELAEALSDMLSPAFVEPRLLKLGFSLLTDLQVLQRSCKHVRAFDTLNGVLELQNLAGMHTAATNHVARTYGSGSTRTSRPSLASVCREWLGRDLNKSEQVSDWDVRPLSAEQVKYAALDAWVLTALLDKAEDVLGTHRCKAMWEGRKFDVGPGLKVTGGVTSQAHETVEDVLFRALQTGTLTREIITFVNVRDVTGSRGVDVEEIEEEGRREKGEMAGLEGLDDNQEMSGGVDGMLFDTNMLDSDVAAAEEAGDGDAEDGVYITEEGGKGKTEFAADGCEDSDDGGWGDQDGDDGAGMDLSDDRPSARQFEEVRILYTKSVALIAEGIGPVMVVAPEDQKVKLWRVAQLLAVQRRVVRLASSAECTEVFGYPPGSVPPIALRCRDPQFFLDRSLHAEARETDTHDEDAEPAVVELICGAGAPGRVFRCTSHELLALAGPHARVEDVCSAVGSESAGDGGRDVVTVDGEAEVVTSGVDAVRAHGAETKFLLDAMLGRLCKWLRVLGVDVQLHDALPGAVRASPLKQVPPIITSAKASGRVVLTRDHRLAESRRNAEAGVRCFLVRSNETEQQLEEVMHTFGIVCSMHDLMSRCSSCNGKGFEEVPRDKAERMGVPPKALETVDVFWGCANPDCGKLYWQGPKYDTAQRKFTTMVSSIGRLVVAHQPAEEDEVEVPDDNVCDIVSK